MNNLKSFLILLAGCITLRLSAQIPITGLVGFYPFHNNTLDSSTNHFDASAAGCVFTTDRFGNSNSALAFDGVDDSLVIPLPGFTPLGENFTISFWMKTTSPEKLNLFSLKESPFDTTNNFEIQFSSNSYLQSILELYYGFYTYWNGSGFSGNYLAAGSVGTWYNGEWHHHVLVRQNDSLHIWHDRENYLDMYYDHDTATIGDALDFVVSASPNRLKGTVDDIAFYDRALSSSEILNLFHDHNPYEFISPKKTDAYFEGDTALVWWKWDATQVSDSINLEYRINETGDWMLTEQNHLVDWTPFYFPLPYPPGTKIELRITDKLYPSNTKTTGAFIITEYQWQLVNDSLPFTYRDGCGLLNFKNKMWLLGGWDPPYHEPTYTCSEIYSSADGINWEYHGEAPWPPRHISGWQVHDDAMYIVGGDPQSGNLSDVWKSEDGINWIQLLDSIPYFLPHRNSIMTASVNDYILNFGGQQVTYEPGSLNEVWKSYDGIEWEQLPDAPWEGRGMILNSCVDTNTNTVWMLGGGRVWDRRCYQDVWKTTDGIDWELVNDDAPWGAKYWHTTAWFDNKMWVICGITNQTDNSETWYSADGITWYEIKHPKYTARHGHATTVFDNALWMMTGIGTNDSWKLVNTNPPVVEIVEEIKSEIYLYSNPALFYVTIETHSSENKNIFVYDALGNMIKTFLSVAENVELNVSEFSAGIYFVKIESEGRVRGGKFVKG